MTCAFGSVVCTISTRYGATRRCVTTSTERLQFDEETAALAQTFHTQLNHQMTWIERPEEISQGAFLSFDPLYFP